MTRRDEKTEYSMGKSGGEEKKKKKTDGLKRKTDKGLEESVAGRKPVGVQKLKKSGVKGAVSSSESSTTGEIRREAQLQDL